MKRFRPAMLNTLTYASLALAVAMAASWLRSDWRSDWIWLMSSDRRIQRDVEMRKGGVVWHVHQGDETVYERRNETDLGYRSTEVRELDESPNTFLGFGWVRTVTPLPSHETWLQITIPHAYLIALFAALPAIQSYTYRRRLRLAMIGHCSNCGYDLRATPDRCPECGTEPAAVIGPRTDSDR